MGIVLTLVLLVIATAGHVQIIQIIAIVTLLITSFNSCFVVPFSWQWFRLAKFIEMFVSMNPCITWKDFIEKTSSLQAITHVDFSARVQTVAFHTLLTAIKDLRVQCIDEIPVSIYAKNRLFARRKMPIAALCIPLWIIWYWEIRYLINNSNPHLALWNRVL